MFHQKALLTIAAEKRVAKRSERAFQKVVRYTERGKIKSRSPYQRTLPARPKSPHVRTPARARLMQNIAQWCERRQELHETARLKRSADFKDNYDDASAVKLTPSPDFLWTSASVQRPKYQWSMDSVATGAGSSLAYSGAGSGSLARQAQKVVERTIDDDVWLKEDVYMRCGPDGVTRKGIHRSACCDGSPDPPPFSRVRR